MTLIDLSSTSLIYSLSVMLFNGCMQTIEETRLARLNILIKEVGGITALTKRLDISYSQVSQWVNQSVDSKTGKPRSINSASARNLEVTFNKPRGWMDQPVFTDSQKVTNAIDTLISLSSEDATKIAEAIKVLCPQEKASSDS